MKIYKSLELDPFQVEALAAIRENASVLVAAPTGAGKTLIAEYAIERSLEEGSRIVYTAPIKALSNQKFRDFAEVYGDRVGIMTGDVTINPSADAVIMTTEVFRNTIFDEPERLEGTSYVIFDEVHYLDDRDRGTVWEESIIFAPQHIKIIGLSATISNLDELADWMREVRRSDVRVVQEGRRPVPLHPVFYDGRKLVELPDIEKKLKKRKRRGKSTSRMGRSLELLDRIHRREHLPCIFFLFGRNRTEKLAGSFAQRQKLLTADEESRLARKVGQISRELGIEDDDRFESLERLLHRGVAHHHAGMLPAHKEVVERLFTSGLIKLLCATSTFALGVNMPARSVAFEDMKRFNGVDFVPLTAREFQQMAGRAGRRGIDDEGHAYVCVHTDRDFPPPDRIRRIVSGEPEPILSRFDLAYSAILSLYDRLGEGIFDACEQSFMAFRERYREDGRGAGRAFRRRMADLDARLEVLHQTGYIDERGGLTTKGTFAKNIYGWEIQVAEIFFGGILDDLDDVDLAVVATAIVHQSKPRTWYREIGDQGTRSLKQRVDHVIRPFRAVERGHEIDDPVNAPDWRFSACARAWAEGAPFEDLTDYTDKASGDVVRTFRMGIQILRMLRKGLPHIEHDPDLDRVIQRAFRTLRRGVVDAEAQLRSTVHMDLSEETAEQVLD